MRTRFRRFFVSFTVAALAVSGVATSEATEDPTDDTPIVVTCVGTGGYDDAGGWVFEPANRPGPHHPFATADLCASFSVASANIPPERQPPGPDEIEQDPFSVTGYALIDGLSALPTGMASRASLRGMGDLACGNGTVSGTAPSSATYWGNNVVTNDHGITRLSWGLDWSATFTDGHAELSGTAYPTVIAPRAPFQPDLEPRNLRGTLDIDYGGPLGDECDDSDGAAQVVATFILESQS